MQKHYEWDPCMLNNISSSSALKLGIAFSILFSGFIWLADWLWFNEPTLLPDHTEIGFWYAWQLKNPDIFSRSSAWILYLMHQGLIWLYIFKAQQSKPKYISGLHWFNISALLTNALFIFLHLIQTHIWYDGLAQDVLEQSSQWSVIVLLFVVLMMENQRRGLFLGHSIDFVTQASRTVRQYHGYYFAWATIYTFWYHPMVMTQGHLLGFFYMFLLLLQGSLFYTRVHLNPKWTIFVEVMVVVHALLVAIMNGDSWPMFLLGFLGVFVVTQMYGLPLSQKMRWLIWSAYIGLIIIIFNAKGLDDSYRFILIVGTEWGSVILFSGLILCLQSDFIKKLISFNNN